MRRIATRLFILAVSLCLLLALLPSGGFAAERRPYFKAFGGDIMTGGWFSQGTTCDTDPTSDYQDGRNAAGRLTGGVVAYARSAVAGGTTVSQGGASAQFAAFILGQVDGNTAANYGFYSNGSNGGGVASRTFSNNAAAAMPWGGLFQDDQPDGVRQSLCIPNYYSQMLTGPAPTVLAPGSMSAAPTSGIYSATAPGGGNFQLRNGEIIITPGRNVTVFVDGNLYISHNIRYNLNTVDNIPKFTVVVKGNIYIDPNVTELNGFYVAQPLPRCGAGVPAPCNPDPVANDTGVIWTCHPNNTTAVPYTYPAINCGNKLKINGGIVAKQVILLRVNGDVNGVPAGEDTLAGIDSANIAEVINYGPAIPLGGPFLTSTSSSDLRNPIDSIISLPPIF